MGLWDKIRGQFIDVIAWTDPSQDTMVYRFERQGNEIKYGAQLIVRESQVAVFINEGKLADVFEPGTHELKTENLPILTTLKSWKHGFESPFKAEVYFISTKRFTDLKWGTKNPIMLRDPEFGPVRLRAFGTYVTRVVDPAKFIREIAGTDGHFTTDEITDQLRNMLVARFADLLGECKIPVLDLAANYDELSEFAAKKLSPEFDTYGLDLTKFLVENISLPEAVERALDKRTSMGMVGNLQAYTQFQTAEALEAAAKNTSGLAGGGMALGMGFGMAQTTGQAMNPPAAQAPPPAATPPPIPSAPRHFLVIGGKREGPFDMATLTAKARDGELTRETLAWREGMAQWAPAGEVKDLAGAFTAVPPPVPPPPPPESS